MFAVGAGQPGVDLSRRLADNSDDNRHAEHLRSLTDVAHAGWPADRSVGAVEP